MISVSSGVFKTDTPVGRIISEAQGGRRKNLRSLMDPSVVESLQALERTAAWVNQVAQMRQMVS